MPTTHFAPLPHKLSADMMLSATPLITVTALAGVPGLVRSAFGDRVLRRATEEAMIDIEAIEDLDCFIPHLTVTTFADAVARLSGEPYFSLGFAPQLTMASKGCWGSYMLAAPTLGEAIARGIGTIGFHSKGDRMSLSVSEGEARLAYASAARGMEGYLHVAVGTAGILLSLCKAFQPPHWHPLRIELDLARPPHADAFEAAFGCPVVFEADRVCLCFEAGRLGGRPSSGGDHPPMTAADVARARIDCRTLDGFRDIILQQVWAQVLSGTVSVESAACAVGTSVRTLQRELNREGASFRDLANAMRTRRAMELLRDTNASVTEISTLLGYSAPAHFARAFRRATGLRPHDVRRPLPAGSPATHAAAAGP